MKSIILVKKLTQMLILSFGLLIVTSTVSTAFAHPLDCEGTSCVCTAQNPCSQPRE